MKSYCTVAAKFWRAMPRVCAIAILCAALAPAYGEESSIKEGVKNAGHAIGSAARQVGHDAKKASKEIGPATKRVGKSIGNAAKEGVAAMKNGGKKVKHAVTGEDSKD
jgi:hypothetical protein